MTKGSGSGQTEIGEEALHLDVDAQVVRQLGTELITDPEQAILELVKNSYDADAEWCNIVIDTEAEQEINLPGTDDKLKLKGKVVVDDGGSGMNRTALQQGWLTISLSPKRKMKEAGVVTPIFKRTPLGDKGLGRLGTMKLGDYLRITTHDDPGATGLQVAFLWSQCKSGRALSKVPISEVAIPKSGKTGTKIEICGLVDPEYWRGEARINELRFKLSTLVSPFKTFPDFDIGLTIDRKPVDLVSFSKRVLNTAATHFETTWDDSELELNGQVKLTLFRGLREEDFQRYVLSDEGRTLFEHLESQSFASKISLRRSKDRAWFLDFSEKKAWDHIPLLRNNQLPIAKPGDFVAELYGFNLNFSRTDADSLFTEPGEMSKTIKELSGVYIFRNNFRVRASNDWLRLGEEWTSGGSYYGLRPKNTIGYFAISTKSNPKLVEKSDREGFVENREWRGFFALAEEMKSFANTSLEDLRRAYLEFISRCKKKDLGFPEGVSAEEQVAQLGELAKAAKGIGSTLSAAAKQRTRALAEAKSQISSLLADSSHGPKTRQQLAATVQAIDSLVEKINEESTEVHAIVQRVAEKEKLAEVILERFEQLDAQIAETYETVGVGLAAQGLVHELHPLLDDITARSRRVKANLASRNLRDTPLQAELDTIRNIANLIARKMSFLDPMLRTFRETREDINLEEFTKDYFALRKDRFDRLGIKARVLNLDEKRLFLLNINRGRLTQVLDNLARNSEYWLRDAWLKNAGAKLEMTATLDSPKMVFADTGPGVRPALEKVLFDIFVSDKPKGQGHGLGLFIVSQILKAEGCSVILGPNRNANGRRFQFIVDFSGVIK